MSSQVYKVEPVRIRRNGEVIGYAVIDRETRERALVSILSNAAACRLCQCLNRIAGGRVAGLL